MDWPEQVKDDGGTLLDFLIVLIIVAPFHTVLAKALGYACMSIFATDLYRIIHIILFCTMSSTLRFLRMTWTLVVGVEPTERLPTQRVGDVIAEIVLLLTYGAELLFFNYGRSILYSFWSHFLHLFYLGIGFIIILPICTRAFIWTRQRTGYLYKSQSTFTQSLRLLMTVIVVVCSMIYECCAGLAQLLKNCRAYERESSRLQPATMLRTAANSAYQYEELHAPSQEIRLIKLTKGLFSGVRCTLKRFPLDEAPTYEAISYTWGSPNKDHVVIFNGHWLLTAKSVYNIIQDRAAYYRPRWLWIDAVCINQNNTQEKDFQVSIMGEIYHSADRVIIWLGDIPVKTAAVFSTCFLLNKLEYNIQHLAYYKDRMENLDMVTGSNGMWDALRQFLSHPYWRRMWVIQEVAKARRVYILYGGWYLPWDQVFPTIDQLTQDAGKIMLRESGVLKVNSVDLIEGIFQVSMIAGVRLHLQGNRRLTLENALQSTFKCEATDPRDRIFALYNLIELEKVDESIDMTPHYTASVQEIYARTAQHLLYYHSSFGILRSGIGHTRNTLGLASWVPDWTAHIIHPLAGDGEYHASGESILQAIIRCNSGNKTPSEILLHGILPISKVKLTSTTPNPTISIRNMEMYGLLLRTAYEAAHFTAFTTLPPTYLATGQRLTEVFWRTLIGDRHFVDVEHQMQRPANECYANYFEVWRTEVEGTKEVGIALDGSFDYGKAMGVALCDGRRLAVTDDGLLAIVPQFTEVGDVVCLVGGVNKPLLMRPEIHDGGDQGERWRIVGDCYVHGIMDGELWEERDVRSFIIY